LCIIYTYFRIPEPKGRTFAELDLLFERKVSARQFHKTHVDVFDESVDENTINRYKHSIAAHPEKIGGIGDAGATTMRVGGGLPM
jgi:MFS transporter, SP family, general alpha glucoside:H+ symporter